MSDPKEKLNEMIKNLNDVEIDEVVNFVEFINEKKQKTFDKAFKTVAEVNDPLTDEELSDIEESKNSGTLSYKEMFSL